MIEKNLYFPIIKLFLTSVFLTVLAVSAYGQDPAFFEKVLSYQNCRYCYFVSLKVSSNEYNGTVVIENDDLFSYLSESNDFDTMQYTKFMKDLLMSGRPLLLDNVVLGREGLTLNIKNSSKNHFRIPKANDDLEKTLRMGCVATVARYFLDKNFDSSDKALSQDCHDFIGTQKDKNLMISVPLGLGEETMLIARLFDWRIPVRIDDMSGRIVISK